MESTRRTYIAAFFVLTTFCLPLQIARAHSPHDTVIAFDIHDVLMQRNVGKTVGKFIKNPALLFKIGKLTSGNYGNDPELRKVVNSQKPLCDTWKVVKQLKKAGYPIYIFSNIDKKAFDDLCKKFPKLFGLFDGYHVIHENNKTQKKPAPSAYASCKALIEKQHAGKQIIFIDDQKENIKAALKAGFKGIRFISASQLKKDLKPLLG